MTVPNLELQKLNCRATIDYVTLSIDKSLLIPKFCCAVKHAKAIRQAVKLISLHDPKKEDIQIAAAALSNPLLTDIELSLDFYPKKVDSESEELLRSTFVALAARFRPEDMAAWGYGARGGLTGMDQEPIPFHQRLPAANEQLIYGGKGDYMQSKMYLKTVDQGAVLPDSEHRVRLELRLRAWGTMTYGLDRVGALIGYPFRKIFTKHFRIVSGPEVRDPNRRSQIDLHKLEQKMNRAWNTAGVGKFAVNEVIPPDTSVTAIARIKARSRRQLPMTDFKLKRDQAANAKIGEALKNLQRRMS